MYTSRKVVVNTFVSRCVSELPSILPPALQISFYQGIELNGVKI